MSAINFAFNRPAWPDLAGRTDDQVLHLTGPIAITAVPAGMKSGATSVCLRIDLPDGRIVLQETSLRVLSQAVSRLLERYGCPT